MNRLTFFALLGLTACQTDEMRAWDERRAQLERRRAELQALEANAAQYADALAQWDAARAALDLAGFVRTRGVPATVFVEQGAMRAKISGTTETCAEGLGRLAPMAWVLPHWRLRLEGERCEWEGRTGEAFVELERKVVLARPSWTAPAASRWSRGLEAVRADVAALEADVADREKRLGGLATLGPIADAAKDVVARAKAAPRTCPLEVVTRELAQDTRGALLELTDAAPVHPLEPAGDARLRGLLEAEGAAWRWRCSPLEPSPRP